MTDISGPSADELGLFTDLYELTMAQAYWAWDMHEPAVFSLFFRKPPRERNVVLACGQTHAARLATEVRFPRAQLDRLAGVGPFQDGFLRWLEDFRFRGDIHALPEGTPVFPSEPLLEVRASVAEAQVLETLLMNHVGLETLLASKALRVVLAAQGRSVVDFGMRRMHGSDAALRGVRAYRVAGVDGTSHVLGALRHGLPARGTMAHSWIQAHAQETEAFRRYARLYPGTTLLIDTYDTQEGVERVIRLVRDEGLSVAAVRLDSGDPLALSREVRHRLDRAGLHDIGILVSGGLDEHAIAALVAAGAPVDGFGVGTEMGTSSDAPSLDLVYKLTEYAGSPRLKRSAGKATVPGAKQVWRYTDEQGRYTGDEITRRDEERDATPLLEPVVVGGEPVGAGADTEAARTRAWDALHRLPEAFRGLEAAASRYPVHLSEALDELRKQALREAG